MVSLYNTFLKEQAHKEDLDGVSRKLQFIMELFSDIPTEKDPFIQNLDFVDLEQEQIVGNDWLNSYIPLEDEINVHPSNVASCHKLQFYVDHEDKGSPDKQHLPIADEKLADLPVRELNKTIRNMNLTKAQIQALRKRRRSLKNRGYAMNCRNKRVTENEELTKRNRDLIKELKQIKSELNKTLKEKEEIKKQNDKLRMYFNTLCSSSAAVSLEKGVPMVHHKVKRG